MDALAIIAQEAIKAIFKRVAGVKSEGEQDEHNLERRLQVHLREVLSWSEKIEFFGLTRGGETDTSTIPLRLDILPRKFRSIENQPITVDEKSLLAGTTNHLLLGDPGAGKTTTIKRLARAVLLSEPSDKEDTWQYPIVIRLRELKTQRSLEEYIADIFGIKYVYRETGNVREYKDDGSHSDTLLRAGHYAGDDSPLREIVADVLNVTQGILFLDGLDEVATSQRDHLEEEIEALARLRDTSKIVLSCRSGDYARTIEGFQVFEICPLADEEKVQIAKRGIKDRKDQDEFLETLESLPYADIAIKPLFLCQLIAIYNNTGRLPDRPSSVYRKIIRLALEDWDTQRRVRRGSKYAAFDSDRKMEFLSALSYQLTYRIKTTRFGTDLLTRAYLEICEPFSLPTREAVKVAVELESHTGIIVESGDDYFQFSHLSLQEFLCADYLVREPFTRLMPRYLHESPASVAVAISLSASPSEWFAGMFLTDKWAISKSMKISSLLSRLLQEKPSFSTSMNLGLATMQLLFKFDAGMVLTGITGLLSNPHFKASLRMAASCYSIKYKKGQMYYLRLVNSVKFAHSDLQLPTQGYIACTAWDELAQELNLDDSSKPILEFGR